IRLDCHRSDFSGANELQAATPAVFKPFTGLDTAGVAAKNDAKPVIGANSTSNAEYESSKSKYDGNNNQIVHTNMCEGFRMLRARWFGAGRRSQARASTGPSGVLGGQRGDYPKSPVHRPIWPKPDRLSGVGISPRQPVTNFQPPNRLGSPVRAL
ncbi:hypothetical protein, partial [Aeromonas caviae]|uniref:hypothetical protein n=1 Tax=Aeromonas caviae TaxID=648 RepID=UPI001FC838C3